MGASLLTHTHTHRYLWGVQRKKEQKKEISDKTKIVIIFVHDENNDELCVFPERRHTMVELLVLRQSQ